MGLNRGYYQRYVQKLDISFSYPKSCMRWHVHMTVDGYNIRIQLSAISILLDSPFNVPFVYITFYRYATIYCTSIYILK
jgi:hypothetical protein